MRRILLGGIAAVLLGCDRDVEMGMEQAIGSLAIEGKRPLW